MPNEEYQQCRVFVRTHLLERKIKCCRKLSKIYLEFKKQLGLHPNVVTCDEQDVISALQVAFKGETILTQHCIEIKELMLIFL